MPTYSKGELVAQFQTKYSKPTTMVVTVTPELAMQFLKNMAKNRSVNPYRVNTFSIAILEKRWPVSQPLGFLSDGRMFDGQNRCLAIVKAGVPVDLNVTFGLSVEAAKVWDTGRPRSVADHAQINMDVSSPRKAVAVVRMIDSLFTNQRQAMDNDRFEERYKIFGPDVQWALEMFCGGGKINNTPIRAGLAMARRANQKGIEIFATQIKTADGLKVGDPAFSLRHYFLETNTPEKDDLRWQTQKVLSAAYAFLRGERLTKIFIREEALNYFFKFYPTIPRQDPLQEFVTVRRMYNPKPPTQEEENIIFEFINKGRETPSPAAAPGGVTVRKISANR